MYVLYDRMYMYRVRTRTYALYITLSYVTWMYSISLFIFSKLTTTIFVLQLNSYKLYYMCKLSIYNSYSVNVYDCTCTGYVYMVRFALSCSKILGNSPWTCIRSASGLVLFKMRRNSASIHTRKNSSYLCCADVRNVHRNSFCPQASAKVFPLHTVASDKNKAVKYFLH